MGTVVFRKQWSIALVMAVTAVLSGPAAWAAEATPIPAPQPAAEKPAEKPAETPAAEAPGLTGENALLAREAKLDDEQKKRLAETVAEGTKAMNEWRERNREAIAAFQQALTAARQARDEAAFRKAIQDHQDMLKEQVSLQAKFNKRVMDILTPEQEAAWFGFLLSRDLTQQAEALNLSDAQKTKTRTMCNEAAGKLAALRRSEKTDAEKATESQIIQGGLIQQFLSNVLTDEQRTKIRGEAEAASPAAPPTE